MSSKENSGSLKGKFQDFGSAPSEGLWDNIAGSLDEKKKRRAFIWWWLGGLSAMLLISFSMYQLGFHQGENSVVNNDFNIIEKPDNQNDNQASSSDLITPDSVIQDIEADNDINDEIVAIDDGTSKESEQIVKKSDENSSIPILKDDNNFLPTISTFSNIEINRIEKENIELKDLPEVEKIANAIEIPYWDSTNDTITDIIEDDEKIERPWFWGLSFAYSKPTNNDNYTYEPTISSLAMDESFYNAGGGTITNSGISPQNLGIAPNPIIESWVTKPISLDFMIGKYFSDRFSWETGLSISRTNYFTYYDAIDIQYVKTSVISAAVPLNINYDIIQKNRFNFRTSLGLITEVPFHESIKTYVYSAPTKVSNFKFGLLGALQLDLSAEFKLKDNLSINLGPNYRYYYMQRLKSEHPLVRKDSWLGVTIGLIWEI